MSETAPAPETASSTAPTAPSSDSNLGALQNESAPWPVAPGLAKAPSEAPRKNPRTTAEIRAAIDGIGEPDSAVTRWEAELRDQADRGEAADQSEPTQEAPKDPSAEKTETQKREKFSAKNYSKQHAALTRRQRAVQEAEQKVATIIAEKEAEFAAKEARFGQLEKLTELDELDLIKRVAEAKGQDYTTVLRRAIWTAAGHKGSAPTEQPKSDPKLQEALDRIERYEAHLAAQAREAEERADNAILSSVAETALAKVNEESHPFLASFPPEVISANVLAVANQQAAYYNAGQIQDMPSIDEILDHLDLVAQAELEPKIQRLAPRVMGAAKQPAPSNPAPSTTPSRAPRAITNGMTAQTGPARFGVRKERELINDAGAFLKSKGF